MDLSRTIRPQPSERWAMYRLICPIVDAASDVSGLEPFFEYSQPNGPNKRLSADIALMAVGSQTPVWLIEAKKYGRTIMPGMIDAYLNPGAMGVVTNGKQWIFKVAGKYLTIGPLLRPDGLVDPNVYEVLVAILSSVDEVSALGCQTGWADTWQRATGTVTGPVMWKVSGGTGSRAFHAKTRYETLQEAAAAARTRVSAGTVPAQFLDRLIASGAQAARGYFEVSEARMIWWTAEGVRGARLKLAGQHMDLLVHNDLVDRVGRNNIQASIKLHDKNPEMSTLKAGLPDELVGLTGLFTL